MNEQARLPDTEVLERLGLPSPKASRRGLIAVVAAVVIAAIAGTAFYVLRDPTATTYVTADVVRGPLVVRVSATGTLQPEDQVDVGAEISGRVDRVTVDFNDKVTKGQVLAVINTDQIRAQLAQAQAELNAARASVINGEATVNETKQRRDRAEGLFARGIVSEQQITEVMQQTTATLTIFLAAVAAISLVVGGIGIMNIMLVSVTERTREIGIRLAIGARERDVLTQFLVEAIMMSALGGVMGIALGLATSFGFARFFQLPFAPSAQTVLLAFVVSAGIGIAFGYFPARRAARLDPIEALRHE
jgi:multidrug efflux pump subunit AcrA (membrane-fusion protein)